MIHSPGHGFSRVLRAAFRDVSTSFLKDHIDNQFLNEMQTGRFYYKTHTHTHSRTYSFASPSNFNCSVVFQKTCRNIAKCSHLKTRQSASFLCISTQEMCVEACVQKLQEVVL